MTWKTPTDSVHRGIEREKSLFHELIHGLIILSTDFWHHVTGNKTRPASDLPTIKAIIILIAIHLRHTDRGMLKQWKDYLTTSLTPVEQYLYYLTLFKREFLVSCVRVRGHGERVIVEEGHKNSERLLLLRLIIVGRRTPTSVPVSIYNEKDRLKKKKRKKRNI